MQIIVQQHWMHTGVSTPSAPSSCNSCLQVSLVLYLLPGARASPPTLHKKSSSVSKTVHQEANQLTVFGLPAGFA